MRAASRIGFPVVVKPLDGNHGRGVSVNLDHRRRGGGGLRAPSARARAVVVESMIEGDDHRLLVVDGKLVAAARRMPGHVVGDGATPSPSWSRS